MARAHSRSLRRIVTLLVRTYTETAARLHRGTSNSVISKIEACKTSHEVLRVANAFVREVRSSKAAARTLRGPMPITSVDDLRAWLRELKAVATPEVPKEARDVFAQLFSCLRAAERRLEAIDKNA